MGNLIHIAEIAVLLLVCYTVGWGLGFGARRLARASRRRAPLIPAERLAVATRENPPEDALVTAPVIAPVNTAPPPGRPVPEAVAPTVPLPEPAAVRTPSALAGDDRDAPLPSNRPGFAWNGLLAGRAAERHQRTAQAPRTARDDTAAPIVVEPAAPVPSAPLDEDAAMRAIEGGWTRRDAPASPETPEFGELGAAVAAAQTAVRKAIADLEVEPDSPPRQKHG